MHKLSLPVIFILLFTAKGFSQAGEALPSIDKSDLPGAGFKPARQFTGESLFGYIDGGAELYLEYGFSALWVSEIGFMGGKYKTEIYRMNGPLEAFGIFSVSRYRCRNIPAGFTFACQTRYQLQICAGQFYISIINSSGNKSDSTASLRIGEAIVHKIKDPTVDLTEYLPGIPSESVKTTAILAKGKLGIINGAPLWEDYFKDSAGFIALIYPEPEKTILSIKFASHEDMMKFALLHNLNLNSIKSDTFKQVNGENIRKLSESHLLIEIPQKP